MPINVSIKTRPGRKDYAFTWVATSDEARSLWDRCEEMATEQGHEAHEIASGVIQQFYKEGEPKSENERRGLKVWVVYAVLRNAVNHIDLASMVDHAGVIAGPPTIFDLAEHQDITAKVKVFKSGRIQMQITGRSALDS